MLVCYRLKITRDVRNMKMKILNNLTVRTQNRIVLDIQFPLTVFISLRFPLTNCVS